MAETDAPREDLSPEEFRQLGHRVIDWIAEYVQSVERYPVLSRVAPGEIASALPDEAPEHSESWDDILRDLDEIVMPGITHWRSPAYFAYFPANSSLASVLGDLVSTGLGVQGMLWSTSPACTEVETRVLDWLAHAVGLPECFVSTSNLGGGVIQGTASESTLAAMLASRQWRLGERHALEKMRVYTSSEAHSSIIKNARICGLSEEQVRLVPVDGALAMDAGALESMIKEDADKGHAPMFVSATTGTTSTCAFDPLDAIGPICEEYGVWMHVDAAYAGSACVCEELRWFQRGLEHADSYTMNPHKWLLTAFDCSALWVRDRRPLLDALSILPEYLRNKATEHGAVIDYRDWQIPLGRRFRALKLWFAMRHFGLEGMRAHIRRSVELATWFERQIQRDPRFELASVRSLGLVCFRLVDDDPNIQDARNEELLDALNDSGEVFLTHTRIPALDRDGSCTGEPRHALRLAVGGVLTRREHVERAWELVSRLAR
ncbi:MAG: pyridoxal-dependent decarboxylase [Phycisphaerales bacterium JB043]